MCWQFASRKDGVSASNLQHTLAIGSHGTARGILYRIRGVLILRGQELLATQVRVDETYIEGNEPSLVRGQAKGQKALVAVAVKVEEKMGFGRCRMRVIPDASGNTLGNFITDAIEPRATAATGG